SLPSLTAGGLSSQAATPAGSTVSADGRYYVYESTAVNLTAGQNDHNYRSDVFLYDRVLKKTTLVSHAITSVNQTGFGSSFAPVISADGSTVAFLSTAEDLIAGYINPYTLRPGVPVFLDGIRKVYLWDRLTDGITLVSHANSNFRLPSGGDHF